MLGGSGLVVDVDIGVAGVELLAPVRLTLLTVGVGDPDVVIGEVAAVVGATADEAGGTIVVLDVDLAACGDGDASKLRARTGAATTTAAAQATAMTTGRRNHGEPDRPGASGWLGSPIASSYDRSGRLGKRMVGQHPCPAETWVAALAGPMAPGKRTISESELLRSVPRRDSVIP